MKTCICDLCRQRVADRHYKFLSIILYPRTNLGWVRLDVCESCYEETLNQYKLSQHKADSIGIKS